MANLTGQADLLNSNSTAEFRPGYSKEVLAATVQLSIYLTVGLLGNGVLLVALVRKLRSSWSKCRRKRNVLPNIMLICLVAGDLWTLAASTPLIFLTVYQKIEDATLCHFVGVIVNSAITLSHLLLTLGVPIERYLAICHSQRTFGLHWVTGIIGVILAVSLSSGLTKIWFKSLLPFPTEYGELRCTGVPDLAMARAGVTAFVAIISFPPFIVLYALILHKIWKTRKLLSRHMCEEESQTQSTAINKKRFIKDTKLVNMMFVVSAIYFLCWTPDMFIIVNVIPSSVSYQFVFLINNASTFLVFGLASPGLRKSMFGVVNMRYRHEETIPSIESQTHQHKL